MFKFRQIFAALAAVAVVFGLSQSVVAAEDDVDRIKSAGVLRVGFAESVPFQFKDPKTNEWMGFNVDLFSGQAKYISQALTERLGHLAVYRGKAVKESVLPSKRFVNELIDDDQLFRGDFFSK